MSPILSGLSGLSGSSDSSGVTAEYCCAGCEAVHALLIEQGLNARYYDLAHASAAAVGDAPRVHNLAWLGPVVDDALDRGGDVAALTLDVQGIHCAACVWLLGELARRHQMQAIVNPALGKVRLRFRRGCDNVIAFVSDVERFGYRFGPDKKRADPTASTFPLRLGVCVAATMNVMLYSLAFYLGLDAGPLYRLFSALALALTFLVVVVGGGPFVRSAIGGLSRGALPLDLPIAVGIVLAFVGSVAQAWPGEAGSMAGGRGYLDTLAVFVTLMVLGRFLQERLIEKNRRLLLEDEGVDGLRAVRLERETPVSIAATAVREGDVLLLAPGDLVPVDAKLLDANGRFALDWITGEAEEKESSLGAIVAAGSMNAGQRALRLRATTGFDASPLPALLRSSPLAKQTAHDRLLRIWTRVYVPLVLGLALLAAFRFRHAGAHRALDAAVALLVVTCPCAVGLALPLAREIVSARLRRAGLFVRSGCLVERLARVKTIVFDKTGTLTLGRIALDAESRGEIDLLDPADRDALYDMACRSAHPISRCLTSALAEKNAVIDVETHVVEYAGRGSELVREGRVYRFGRATWACDRERFVDESTVFTVDGVPLATFVTIEVPRPDARAELAALRAEGFDVWIFSGDAQRRVDAFAAALNLPPDHALGDLRPDEKAEILARIDHNDTLYLGDGINDSLAFDRALCAGTPAIDRPVLPSKSDFFLLGDSTAPIRLALALSRSLRRTSRYVLAAALAYNTFAVALCFVGAMTPLRAALAMPASSLGMLALVTISLAPHRGFAGAAKPPVLHPEAAAWTS